MGTGYTRNDSSNNIADGNVINASDFDGEFDAIVSAFATDGHTHDGTAAEGGPIAKLGPSQQVEVDSGAIFPASDGATDLGKTDKEWKDLFVDGVINTDDMSADTISVLSSATIGSTIDIGSNASVGGTLNVTGDSDLEDVSASGTLDVAGNVSGGGTLTVKGAVSTASTLLVSAGITGRSTLDISGNGSIGGTFRVTDETNLEDVSASGTLDISGNMSGGGTLTLAGKATFDGAVTVQSTLTVAGAVSAHSSLNVTGNISSNGTLTTTGAISDGDGNLRDIPGSQNLSGNYTLQVSDAGNQVNINASDTVVTVPTSVFSIGDIVSLVSVNGCTATIACTAVNAIKAGELAKTASYTLAANGVANVLFSYSAGLAVLTGNI
mgnify:CR=1 FL=1